MFAQKESLLSIPSPTQSILLCEQRLVRAENSLGLPCHLWVREGTFLNVMKIDTYKY